MAKLNRRAMRLRREWSRDHQLMLAHGWNWFQAEGWPDITDLPMDKRDDWPGAEVLAEMKQAWEIHREELIEEFADGRPLWAECVFELGEDPQEVLSRDVRKFRGFGGKGRSKQTPNTTDTPEAES